MRAGSYSGWVLYRAARIGRASRLDDQWVLASKEDLSAAPKWAEPKRTLLHMVGV